jgi:hypothetical protein
MVLVQAEGQHVRQGIFLSIHSAIGNRLNEISDIRNHRLKTKSLQGVLIEFIVEGADHQSGTILRGPDGPESV